MSQVEIRTIIQAICGQHSAFVKHESDDDTDTEPFYGLDGDAYAEIVNCKRKKDSVDLYPLYYREEKKEFYACMQRQGARSHKSVEDIIVQFLTTESSLILQILASLISRKLHFRLILSVDFMVNWIVALLVFHSKMKSNLH